MSTWTNNQEPRRQEGADSRTQLELLMTLPAPTRSTSQTPEAMDLGSPPARPSTAGACGGLRLGQLYGAGTGLPVARPLFGAAVTRQEIDSFFLAAEQKLAMRRASAQ
ncbi:hypothetical protein HXX76_004531 [Chlamydomonas incerta]|uniref:Uncharacterized protein n=1 Tax=Chlamydomonas incerta TaxID=51695 RepID=A0A835T5E2_CHLIN|nr:hypothetical protein HXX76_004531 [Chlamydomonas incerta]|eukprot:KAG2439164.1 hypothetical protein HXX76_004531 [Chlamydomonas incerta]